MKNIQLYNILLFLFILSIAGSTYLFPIDLDFISLYFFRLLLLLILIILLLKSDAVLAIGRFSKMLLIILVIWIAYAAITLLWSEDIFIGIRDIFYLSIGVISHIVLVSLAKKTNFSYKIFYRAWITGFAALIVIAGFEMLTGFHLKGNFATKLLSFHQNHPIHYAAVATFDNPNNFSLYLGISVALFMPLLKTKYRSFIWILISVAALIIFGNNSKIPLAGLGIMAIILLGIKYWPHRFSYYKLLGLAVISLLMICSILLSNTYLIKETEVPSTEISTEPPLEQQKLPESSVNIRKNLIFNGWEFFKDSYGFGIGAGMYSYYIEHGMADYYVSTVRNPHNWIMEIISQYGIIIFLLLLIWGLWTFYYFLSNIHLLYENSIFYPLITFGIMMCIAYVINSNSSSSFIQLPINWISLSLIAIVADRLYSLKKEYLKHQ